MSKPAIPSRLMKGPADRQAVDEGCWYDAKAADRVVKFFNTFLCHSKGEWAGKPFALLEWQEWDIIRPLFGWKRPDGTRRFRRAYIEVPKKNGKSTLSSGIALYLLFADREPGAEVYSAAADRDQASIVYREAKNMVENSPALRQRLRVTDSKKIISDPLSKSWYRALSADVPTKEGLNIHGLIFDELHAQQTRTLWDALKYGGAARRQPLFVSITTAGFDRTSICYDQHKYAKRVLDGSVKDISFFAYISAAGQDDDWTDPKVWAKANPGYGITIHEDAFKADFLEAQENASSQNSFRRYRLNQWTEQDTRWLDMVAWRKCVAPMPELSRDAPFFGALDLASTQDLAAYVQLFPTKGFLVRCHFFIPEECLKRRVRKDKVPYDVWARQGLLTVTRGNTIDEDAIVETVLASAGQHKCLEVAYDRWNASHVVRRLTDEGIVMVPIGQGFSSLSFPSKELEKRVVAGQLNHQGNAILDWMAQNCATETDAAANIKPSKVRSTEKIDGIVALVMALARYVAHSGAKKSKYETDGITAIGR